MNGIIDDPTAGEDEEQVCGLAVQNDGAGTEGFVFGVRTTSGQISRYRITSFEKALLPGEILLSYKLD